MIKSVISIAKKAGEEILNLYNSSIDVVCKKDKSPLTEADKRANKVIENGLKKISDYPILSEEGKNIPYHLRKKWKYFWLVDPLDGTKEFLKKNGEFTTNIALICENKPVFGVVYAPAIDVLYYGGEKIGAYKIENSNIIDLNKNTKKTKDKNLTIVVSKSHIDEETKNFVENLRKKFKDLKTVSIGSSLKICLVAEGKADLYPRLAPTMEWDTAAAHAILQGTGGKIVEYRKVSDINHLKDFPEIVYNKESLLNPHFVAFKSDVF